MEISSVLEATGLEFNKSHLKCRRKLVCGNCPESERLRTADN